MARRYRSRLREEQAAATRERILDAAHALLRTTRPVDLSWREIARVAETSTRTVYRHFPEPDALFLALSDRLIGRLLPSGEPPTTLEAAVDAIGAQFRLLDEDPALFRVFFAVPTRSRFGHETLYRAVIGPWIRNLPDEHQRPLFAVLDLLGSPYAWDVFHANWQVDARRAHRTVLVAMRALLDHVAAHPDALDPDGPHPLADWEVP